MCEIPIDKIQKNFTNFFNLVKLGSPGFLPKCSAMWLVWYLGTTYDYSNWLVSISRCCTKWLGCNEFNHKRTCNAVNMYPKNMHTILVLLCFNVVKNSHFVHNQSSRSPKIVALFSATNFSSYIIELLQLHDTIQIKWNHTWIHYNMAIRSHFMI